MFCLPSIQAGGGAVHNLISQRKSGIPPKPPFRFSFSQTERERKQSGKNSFPPTPFLFCPPAWASPPKLFGGTAGLASIFCEGKAECLTFSHSGSPFRHSLARTDGNFGGNYSSIKVALTLFDFLMYAPQTNAPITALPISPLCSDSVSSMIC